MEKTKTRKRGHRGGRRYRRNRNKEELKVVEKVVNPEESKKRERKVEKKADVKVFLNSSLEPKSNNNFKPMNRPSQRYEDTQEKKKDSYFVLLQNSIDEVNYDMDDYKKFKYSISKSYQDMESLIFMTNDVNEAKSCIVLYPKLKVFNEDGILCYPAPSLYDKHGYHIKELKTGNKIRTYTSFTDAINNCGIKMGVFDSLDNRIY